MGYERNERRYGRDLSYGYRPDWQERDRERGYAYAEDRSYNRDRGYGDGRYRTGRVDYGRGPDGYDYDDRGFFERAGDEVRSWFGDEEAERRRRLDERYAERARADDRAEGGYGYYGTGRPSAGPPAGYGWSRPDYGAGRGAGATMNYGLGSGHDRSDWGSDPNYHAWRSRQIEQLDRDYADYRREHQQRFDGEFGSWRDNRNLQRGALDRVQEHDEVVGSDGAHVGKVDKVRGDRIILTKSDADAHGHHHSIPSAWITTSETGKVMINRTADQAKQAWRDEERSGAVFGSDRARDGEGPHILNRSFSGTY